MKKAVVIGVTYSTRLNLARSLSRVGFDVTLIYFSPLAPGEPDPNPPFDTYSNCVSRCYHVRKLESDLIPLLMDKCADPSGKVLLLPACDYSIAIVDANQNVLRGSFLFPHINHIQGELTAMMDKTVQKALAREVGLNVVDATEVIVSEGKYDIPDAVKYPCFPKPASSFKGGKGGLVKCDDSNALAAAIDDIVAKGGTDLVVLVEDFVDIETEYALVGFSDGQNVIIPALLQLLVVSKAYNGIALKGKVVPTTGYETLLEGFKDFMRKTGFIGVFDIDFYRSGDRFYFGEMNLRFGGSGDAVTRIGVDLPAMYARYMTEGRSTGVYEFTPVTSTAIYVNDKICFDDLRIRAVTFRQNNRFFREADIRFMPDKKDSEPFRRYHKAYMEFALKLEVKKIVGLWAPKYRKYRQSSR